jgi:tRNA pseudouridine55 synthase
MFGFFNINKSGGVTSRDVVNKVQRLLPRKTKLGHAGTLDPMATGVLVLCVGPATRLVPYVQELTKSYRAGFRLGCRSDTDDSTGNVVETPDVRSIDREEIAGALERFRGRIQQMPPQFSALHVNGQRAYDLARAGVAVELAAREVEISKIELLRCDGRDLEVDIDCSSGTYIRSIARDLGEALGVGGLMTSLVRTGIGPFRIESAVTVDELSRETIAARLLPPTMALANLPQCVASESEVAQLRQGKSIPVALNDRGVEACVVDAAGRLVALGEVTASRLQPRTVFANALD